MSRRFSISNLYFPLPSLTSRSGSRGVFGTSWYRLGVIILCLFFLRGLQQLDEHPVVEQEPALRMQTSRQRTVMPPLTPVPPSVKNTVRPAPTTPRPAPTTPQPVPRRGVVEHRELKRVPDLAQGELVRQALSEASEEASGSGSHGGTYVTVGPWPQGNASRPVGKDTKYGIAVRLARRALVQLRKPPANDSVKDKKPMKAGDARKKDEIKAKDKGNKEMQQAKGKEDAVRKKEAETRAEEGKEGKNKGVDGGDKTKPDAIESEQHTEEEQREAERVRKAVADHVRALHRDGNDKVNEAERSIQDLPDPLEKQNPRIDEHL